MVSGGFRSFLVLVSTPNFIVWLRLILEMLGNICVVIISFPIGEFINFKITIAFLSSRFPI